MWSSELVRDDDVSMDETSVITAGDHVDAGKTDVAATEDMALDNAEADDAMFESKRKKVREYKRRIYSRSNDHADTRQQGACGASRVPTVS